MVFALETIVENFGGEMAPFAVGLCQHLARAFWRLQVSLHQPYLIVPYFDAQGASKKGGRQRHLPGKPVAWKVSRRIAGEVSVRLFVASAGAGMKTMLQALEWA